MEYLMLPSYLVSDPRRRQPASYFEILKRRRDEGNSGAEDTEHHNEQGQSNEKSDGFGRSFSSWRSFPSAPPSSSSSCEITLTTHVSLETLHYVDSIAQTWAGPISVAVYVDEPAQLDGIEKTLWDASTRWETEGISRVTMHLLLGPRFNDPGDDPQNFESSHYDPFARLRDIGMGQGRHPYDFAYPVNALRNLAMEQSNTELVFNMDPEFQPSESMHERLCRQQTQKSFRSHFKRRGAMFIVPEFEYASDAVMELVKKTKPGEEDQSVTILKRTETEEHSVSREDGPDLRTATGQVDGPPVAPVLDRHKSINTTHLLQLCAELKVLPHKAIPSLRILEEPSLPPPSSPLTQSNNANETATPGPPQIPQKVIDNWCSGLSRTLEGFTLAKENTLINYQRWLRATYKSTRSEAALKSPNPSSSSSDLKSAEVNIGPFPYRLTYNGGHSLSVYEVRMLEPCCWVGHRHQMPQFDEVFRGGTYARRQPVLDAAVAGFDFSVLTDVFVMYRGGGTGNGGSGDTPLRSQTGVGSSASAAGVPASFTVESHLDHPRLRWEMIKDVLDATFAHFHNNIKARATSKKMQFRKMYRQLFWAEGFM
ncbi:hypothetical protein HK102_013632 [Quaeritorhiza haematococci]|nr:hypothetical protein HK102_013632 [Quaeritorhiza haematococci]